MPRTGSAAAKAIGGASAPRSVASAATGMSRPHSGMATRLVSRLTMETVPNMAAEGMSTPICALSVALRGKETDLGRNRSSRSMGRPSSTRPNTAQKES